MREQLRDLGESGAGTSGLLASCERVSFVLSSRKSEGGTYLTEDKDDEVDNDNSKVSDGKAYP